MPRKIRELKRTLQEAGFRRQPKRGKGSHSWWTHPDVPGLSVNLSGGDGDDAKPYQEDDVREAVRRAKETR
jgi:hypothetical protein